MTGEPSRKIEMGDGNYYEEKIEVTGGQFTGGHSNTTIQAQQGASLAEIAALMATLRRALPGAGLDADTAEVIDADVQVVEAQAAKPKPNGAIVVSKLESITKMLAAASGAAVAARELLPVAQQALQWAQQMFK
jgi:hypothetical protein